jgi:HTH-type transcriptional regulator / antitoxin HipB
MHAIATAQQIGSALIARRKTLGHSQNEIGTKLNLSQNRISELETNPGTMTVAQLLALANVLGLELRLGAPTPGKSAKVEW